MVKHPYTVIESCDKYEIRHFGDFDPKELFWHRDREDRAILLLSGKILLQFDNRLPFEVHKNSLVVIPKMSYHRVLADSPFTIKVHFIK